MATIEREQAERLARLAEREEARARGRRPPSGLRSSRWGVALQAAVAALALATLAGLLALWPGPRPPLHGTQAMGGRTEGAQVVTSTTVQCPGPVPQRCRRIVVRRDTGARTTITLGPIQATPAVARDARVRIQRVAATPGAHGVEPYALAGYDRRRPILWTALTFAALVLAITGRRGLLAVAGLACSLLLVTKFIVPAILAGSPGLLVALVGALAVMFITVVLTYGLTGPSLAACLGIAITLILAAAGADLVVHAAHLDGRSSELSSFLTGIDHNLSLTGVVLAGIVLATLGVLADMGVTQASAVMALRQAAPDATARELFRRGFGVGRDHLVATTHTLVLVYAGATLPLLLVMTASGVGTVDALNTQDIAEPILGTLIGAIALLISVPLTTALTAAVAARVPTGTLGAPAHAHDH